MRSAVKAESVDAEIVENKRQKQAKEKREIYLCATLHLQRWMIVRLFNVRTVQHVRTVSISTAAYVRQYKKNLFIISNIAIFFYFIH